MAIRNYHVVLQAAKAAMSEEERKERQDIFDDPLHTTLQAATQFAGPYFMFKKAIEDRQYVKKQNLLLEEEMKKNNLNPDGSPIVPTDDDSDDVFSHSPGGLLGQYNKGTVSGEVVPNLSYENLVETTTTGKKGKKRGKNKFIVSPIPSGEDEAFRVATDGRKLWDTPPGETVPASTPDDSPSTPVSTPSTPGDFDVSEFDSVEDFLASVEGFSPTAYWDVNAWRGGYGTDTLYSAKGDSIKVTKRTGKRTPISEPDARHALGMHVDKVFRKELRNKFGGEFYDSLPKEVRISLESLAYNAGSDLQEGKGLMGITEAIKNRDFEKAAKLIEGHYPNDHELYGRRQKEAAFMRAGTQQTPVPGKRRFGEKFTNFVDYQFRNDPGALKPEIYDTLNGYIDQTVEFIKSEKVRRWTDSRGNVVSDWVYPEEDWRIK